MASEEKERPPLPPAAAFRIVTVGEATRVLVNGVDITRHVDEITIGFVEGGGQSTAHLKIMLGRATVFDVSGGDADGE